MEWLSRAERGRVDAYRACREAKVFMTWLGILKQMIEEVMGVSTSSVCLACSRRRHSRRVTTCKPQHPHARLIHFIRPMERCYTCILELRAGHPVW